VIASLTLPAAIARHVTPGMHLHFASTPSRSNASIRELARAFAGKNPRFVFSMSGFHSSAHTLAFMGLGQRYIGCFFGDNYPTPRPSRLYQSLEDGGALEHWSLLTYVLALRAGALGHRYAITSSLAGTALGARLAKAGRYFQLPDPLHPDQRVGLVSAIVPDIAFVHAPVGTASGRAAFTAPYGEGLHAALAARRGTIVTVERLVDDATLDQAPHLVQLPRDRVLAVAEEPFGAHPQPLHVSTPIAGICGYGDDFLAYARWREFAREPTLFGEYRAAVLEAPDGAAAYRNHVGEGTLRALSARPGRRMELPGPRREAPCDQSRPLSPPERLVLLAARAIRRRLSERKHRSMLAGIGQAFTAARLSLLVPGPGMEPVELMIETGVAGFDPAAMHPFLLAAANAAAATRLSSIEDNLGALACGGANRCLAVIGCAEADAQGNVNSSVVGGKLLVGSGGASDLCSNAAEVVVLCRSDRLVERVEFVTSPGKRVLTVVTEDAVLERSADGAPWRLSQADLGGRTTSEVLSALPFAVKPPVASAAAPPPSALERTLLAELLPGSAGASEPRRSSAHAWGSREATRDGWGTF
jgi:acyl CoA:acetate/3-ketoacid CoA transferase alpha subunit